MRKGLVAGIAYFSIVFAIGFVLGTIRYVAAQYGWSESRMVFAEIPIMLAASWVLSGELVPRFSVPQQVGARVAMGGVAFALLMVAEVGVSILAFERTVLEHVRSYGSSRGMVGLLGQIAFALIPVMQLFLNSRRMSASR